MNRLTGHFQSLFFQRFFFISLISPEKKNSKTIKVNQHSVLDREIFYHFSKNQDKTITFNCVTLKTKQTEPRKYFFFQRNK